MRERFWSVLGLILLVLVICFATIGTRSVMGRGLPEAVTDLPHRLIAELGDVSVSLAALLSGTPQSEPPVAAAETPQKPKDPAKQ